MNYSANTQKQSNSSSWLRAPSGPRGTASEKARLLAAVQENQPALIPAKEEEGRIKDRTRETAEIEPTSDRP